MKKKKRVRNCHSPGETKEATKCNMVSWIDPRTEMEH